MYRQNIEKQYKTNKQNKENQLKTVGNTYEGKQLTMN